MCSSDLVVPEADVGGGVGARRATDGALIDVDDLVHDLSTLVIDQTLEPLVGTDDALPVMSLNKVVLPQLGLPARAILIFILTSLYSTSMSFASLFLIERS